MSTQRHLPFRKGIYILPNLLTTASMLCAFVGILRAIDGRFDECAMLIIASALFDGLDGKVARLTGTSSEFGVQYDSLADMVAFGVTPAVMMYLWQLSDFGRMGLMASFLFMTCAALRLARFNITGSKGSKRFFVGLPAPGAGVVLATFILFTPFIPPFIARWEPAVSLLLMYVLSFLMVSRVRYISLKEYAFFRARPFSSLVTMTLLFVLIASYPRFLGFVLLFLYIISGPFYTYYLLLRRPDLLRGSPRNVS